MTNHEPRPKTKEVGLLLAFHRKKDNQTNRKCVRVVIRDFNIDLAILESRLKIIGGCWRIHKTVNNRNTEKARKWLIHKLIDNPEFAGCIDSLWRTALLQIECKADKKYLLDIDTKDREQISNIERLIEKTNGFVSKILERIETPNGWHYITIPFDTRKVCELSEVSVIKDGYVFIKKIGEE